MNADDRILEYALKAHFAAVPNMDLSQDIAQRWADGDPGSLSAGELRELLMDSSSDSSFAIPIAPSRTSLFAQRSRWPYALFALAAAGLVGLLLGLLDWSPPRPSLSPLAPQPSPWQVELEQPLRVLGLPGAGSSPRRLLRSGDAVWVDQGSHAIALEEGLQLRVDAPALFRVLEHESELSLELLAGGLTLDTTGETPLALNGTPVSTLVASRLELKVLQGAGSDAMELSELHAQSLLQSSGRAELSVILESGELQLQTGSKVRSLALGMGVVVLSPDLVVDLAAWSEAKLALAEIMPIGADGMTKRVYWSREMALEQARRLAQLVEEEPGLWDVVERELQGALLHGQLNRLHASVVLDLLVGTQSARPQAVARALWMREPSLYTPAHITQMALSGHFEFQREVAAQLDHWRRWPMEFDEPPLLFATYAALEGDGRGRELLDSTLRAPGKQVLLSGEIALAALGLEALGESSAWELAMDQLEVTVLGLLEEGKLAAAALLLTRLESLADYRESPLEHSWFLGASDPAPAATQGLGAPDALAELGKRLRAVIAR